MTKTIAILLLFFSSLSILAQDSNALLKLFKNALTSIENTEYKWVIERTFEPNDDMLDSLKIEYEAKINAVDPKDPQAAAKIAEHKKQWDIRKSIFGVQRKKKIEVALSYLNPQEWFARQIFFDKNIAITNDYYCSKSGVTSVVIERDLSVNVYHDAKNTLSVIASGQLLFDIEHLMDRIERINIDSEKGGDYKLKIELKNYGYFIANVDKTTFFPKYLCHYYAADRKGFEAKVLSTGKSEMEEALPNRVSFTRFTHDGKHVDYQDDWKAISIRPIIDPSSVKTDYQFKPGYQVTILSGPKTITVRSDELIKRNKK